MIDFAEHRPQRAAWAALCFGLVILLAVLVSIPWQPLLDLDTHLGTWPEAGHP